MNDAIEVTVRRGSGWTSDEHYIHDDLTLIPGEHAHYNAMTYGRVKIWRSSLDAHAHRNRITNVLRPERHLFGLGEGDEKTIVLVPEVGNCPNCDAACHRCRTRIGVRTHAQCMGATETVDPVGDHD